MIIHTTLLAKVDHPLNTKRISESPVVRAPERVGHRTIFTASFRKIFVEAVSFFFRVGMQKDLHVGSSLEVLHRTRTMVRSHNREAGANIEGHVHDPSMPFFGNFVLPLRFSQSGAHQELALENLLVEIKCLGAVTVKDKIVTDLHGAMQREFDEQRMG